MSNPEVPMPLAAAMAFSLLLPAGPVQGLYFEQTTVTYEAGRPTGPGVASRVWCSGKRMRLEAGDEKGGPAFILRLDPAAAYRLEPFRKRAVIVDVARLRTQSQMDLSMAGDLMGAGADDEAGARTRPLTTSRIIAGLPCEGFRITAGSTVMDLYVTRSLPVGVEAFAEFLEWSGASQALGGLLEEVRKLPGFPLETRSRVTVLGEVHETRATVTRVEAGPQPAALFEPPAGYQIVTEDQDQEEESKP
ncbi:MAG: DUF4412 domain-containing protein [Vicinamibacteria bacterium]